jgi:ABC-type phosphate/phosphonate transport system substrate-binding protein
MMRFKILLISFLLGSLVFLWGCGKSNSASQTPNKVDKINEAQTGDISSWDINEILDIVDELLSTGQDQE